MKLSECKYPYSVTSAMTLHGVFFHGKPSFKNVSASAAKGDKL